MTAPQDTNEPAERNRTALWIALAVGIAAVVLVAALLLAGGDDDDVAVDDTTTTTTEAETTTTTTADETTTTTEGDGEGLSPDDRAFVVWPDPGGDARFDDPVEAATDFATELVGYTDPVVGEFQQGDNRSGEVEIRPRADGPVTTVMVRQYGTDDSWWVIGAATENIEVDEPAPQGAVDHPVQVSGRARAFEGNVQVAVYRDGSTEPLGTGFVTGSGGGDLGPFSGEIGIDTAPGEWGSIVFFTSSAEDGQVWEATVVRIGFIGGD